MATNNGFLSTSDLDFQAYRDQLRQFLQSQDLFKDYDFTGSNLSVLIDLLAYNTYVQGTYLNMVGSEMFLDTALLRESIVSHAKELNYTPRSRASSVAYVDIAVSGNNLPTVLNIPKNFRVTGKTMAGQTFSFLTNESINIGAANNYAVKAVPVYEGRIINETFVESANTRFVLASANVDISSIEVNVQNSSTDTANTNWNRQTTLFGMTGDTEAFFVQGYANNEYEVVFGNGIVGASLQDGNVVRFAYRETQGSDANGVKLFSVDQSIQGFSTSVALSTDNGPSAGGSDHETDEEVKFNAPRYFATQERAIIPEDYETLLLNQFPILETVTAFGGENLDPKQYGKVVVSGKPRGGTIVPTSIKDQIVKFLRTRNPIPSVPVFVDPEYFDVNVVSNVIYNLNATTLTPNQIEAEVRQGILDFNTVNLNNFGSDLRFSKLAAAIDNSDPSIVSNDTKVLMTKKLYPLLSKLQNFTFLFGNELFNNATTRYAYADGQDPVVTSSSFGYKVGGTVYISFIQDDGLGTLYTYTVDNTGKKVKLNNSAGTVDYDTGKIVLTNLQTEYITGNSLNIYAKLESADITTDNNSILLVDDSDITISVTGIRA